MPRQKDVCIIPDPVEKEHTGRHFTVAVLVVWEGKVLLDFRRSTLRGVPYRLDSHIRLASPYIPQHEASGEERWLLHLYRPRSLSLIVSSRPFSRVWSAVRSPTKPLSRASSTALSTRPCSSRCSTARGDSSRYLSTRRASSCSSPSV